MSIRIKMFKRQHQDVASEIAMDEPITFDQAAKKLKKTTNSKTRCWGCCFQFNKQRVIGKYPAMDMLWEIFVSNIELMSLEELCLLLERKFQDLIACPAMEMGKTDIPSFTASEILEHIRDHMLDYYVHVKSAADDLIVLESGLKNQIFVINAETGTMETKANVLEMYLRTQKQRLLLIENFKKTKG